MFSQNLHEPGTIFASLRSIKQRMEGLKVIYTIYRVFHLFWTGFLAFLTALPILERGTLDNLVWSETIFLATWLLGAVLLFTRRLNVFGMIFTLAPVVFTAPIFIFSLSI